MCKKIICLIIFVLVVFTTQVFASENDSMTMTYKYGELTIDADSGEAYNATLIRTSNNMQDIEFIPLTFSGTSTFVIPANENDKLMLWDSIYSMIPLCESNKIESIYEFSTVTGYVKDQFGNGIKDVLVRAFNWTSMKGVLSWTDEKGAYALPLLDPRIHTIEYYGPDNTQLFYRAEVEAKTAKKLDDIIMEINY